MKELENKPTIRNTRHTEIREDKNWVKRKVFVYGRDKVIMSEVIAKNAKLKEEKAMSHQAHQGYASNSTKIDDRMARKVAKMKS